MLLSWTRLVFNRMRLGARRRQGRPAFVPGLTRLEDRTVPTVGVPALYDVYAAPATSPLSTSRTLLADPSSPVYSPFGWHDIDGHAGAEFTDTRGNNVVAQEDTNGDDLGGFRPDGGAALRLDFPVDLSQPASASQAAALANAFYITNLAHDLHAA